MDRPQRPSVPHPAGQLLLNAPSLHGRPLPGLQHKYPETVLFFPRQGQTCHAYCTYCFRWAQFIGEPDLKMASDDIGSLRAYLERHPTVTSILLTGGDPMIKSLAYWPGRFVTERPLTLSSGSECIRWEVYQGRLRQIFYGVAGVRNRLP